MSQKVETALTPERIERDAEEWRSWLALSPESRRERLGWARDEVDLEGWTTDRLLAGKALHGRPFGFTWEDVDLLRNSPAEHHGAEVPEWRAAYDSLAERLAALLPPREPDETEEILSDPEAMKRIRTGLDELERGDVVSFEDVFEEPL
jgi:hypothetical protein